MTIPSTPNYPEAFDSDDNLFLVHDSLRVKLVEDYEPGDTSITVEGELGVMDKFPTTGIITLTEQCNEPEFRAISFYYGSKSDTSFDDLELLPEFTDIAKPKRLTNVTMNVIDKHHNSIKDSLIAIEEFLGVKGTVDTEPLGATIVGRLNFLRRLVLPPKAWFTIDKRIGIVPVTITVTDASFRTPTFWEWDFGDGTTAPSGTISGLSGISSIDLPLPLVEGAVSCGDDSEVDTTYSIVSKTYYTPGKYDVTLRVANKFGEDTVVFPEIFIARAPAPDEAEFLVSPAKVRVNSVVNIEVTDNGEQTDDAIEQYTWNLGDDLSHASAEETIAMYSVGGIYDVILRVDTYLGSYRITKLEDAINVVETTNLWLLAFDSPKTTLATTKLLNTYEFGLISESFKSEVMPTLSVLRDYTFTSGYTNEDYQRDLFLRNNGFAQKGTTASGDRGQGILYWAKNSTTVQFKQFTPFSEIWSNPGLTSGDTESHNWNWMGLSTLDDIYLLFGEDSVESEPVSVGQERSIHNMANSSTTYITYDLANYINGSDELLTYADDTPATYRSTVKDGTAYFARNDAGPGGFFRIRNFYKTEGTPGDIATDIRKLPDIPGTARTELQLVSLTSGIFVFNNSGEVSAYNPTTNVWTSGGPGIGAASFRSLQDSSVSGFSSIAQPMLATSDGDRRVYISFDYSSSAFVRFNESDLTFTSLGARPTSNEQFLITVF